MALTDPCLASDPGRSPVPRRSLLHPRIDEAKINRLWAGKLLLLLLSSLFALGLAELGLRLYLYRSLHLPRTERGLRQPHPIFGWSLRPNRNIFVRQPDYAVKVKTNSKGLRDVEHEYQPAPGVFRIVVLGDSFMEAYQVELEESLPRRLQRALKERRVEVINMGVGGYGTIQELLVLKEEGLKYQPDLVILAFLPTNDIRNNSLELERALWQSAKDKVFGRPYARINQSSGQLEFSMPDFARMRRWAETMRNKEENKGYLRRTAIGSQLRHLRKRLMTPPIDPCTANDRGRSPIPGRNTLEPRIDRARINNRRTGPSADPNILFGPLLADFDCQSGANRFSSEEYQRMWNESWRITQSAILQMRTLARRHDAKFMLLVVPSTVQVDESYRQAVLAEFPTLDLDLTKPNRKLAAFSADHNMPALDLLPAFRTAHQEEKARLYHQLSDRHWNADGHAKAASELVPFLDEKKLIP